MKALTTSEAANERKPNPIDIHVGSRVRMRRKLMGVSQEKLAEALGLTFQQVQKYERGVNRVSASKLFETSNFLGVEVSYFFDGLANRDPAAGFAESESERYTHEFLMTTEGVELASLFPRLAPKQRRRILELVRTLADDDD